MKAVILVIQDDDVAQEIANLIGGTLMINGYPTSKPEVVPWPLTDNPLISRKES